MKGNVHLTLEDTYYTKTLELKVKGNELAKWKFNTGEISYCCHNKHDIISQTLILAVFEEGCIKPGSYTFPFEFYL